MNLSQRFLYGLAFGVTHAIFRIHDEELARVPAHGPLIIVMNHVQLLEIPLMYVQLQPRRVLGLVLADRWKNPLMGWVLNATECIPIERGGINLDGINRTVGFLKAGGMVAIMPEGTRSHDGRLQKAHPGVVLLAAKSKAPLLPIVTYGGENYKANLRKLRRTDFHVVVGEPFTLEDDLKALDGQSRRQILQERLDEIMLRLASLLPAGYRGAYG